MRPEVIFHLAPYRLCFGRVSAVPGMRCRYGALVNCLVCGQLGVVPAEGCELEFLPPGTERSPDGRSFIVHLDH
jgi:hypothetical protein